MKGQNLNRTGSPVSSRSGRWDIFWTPRLTFPWETFWNTDIGVAKVQTLWRGLCPTHLSFSEHFSFPRALLVLEESLDINTACFIRFTEQEIYFNETFYWTNNGRHVVNLYNEINNEINRKSCQCYLANIWTYWSKQMPWNIRQKHMGSVFFIFVFWIPC